jgi:hypothetical protein
MGNSFEREAVSDLIVRRRSLRSNALLGVVRLLAALRPYLGINSLLVQAVGSDPLDWCSVERGTRTVQTQEARP